MPTYEEGDLLLFESGAIVHHIAASGEGLLPEDRAARARAIAWMFAALNSVEPPIMDHANCVIFEGDKPWSAQRLPAVLARMDERFGDLSRRLGDKTWLDGDAFTAGDLLMVSVLGIVADDGLLDASPNLVDYVARGAGRGPRSSARSPRNWRGSRASRPPGRASRNSRHERHRRDRRDGEGDAGPADAAVRRRRRSSAKG